jgi:hypothetical protein
MDFKKKHSFIQFPFIVSQLVKTFERKKSHLFIQIFIFFSFCRPLYSAARNGRTTRALPRPQLRHGRKYFIRLLPV